MATERAQGFLDWRAPQRKRSEIVPKPQLAQRKVLVVDDEPLVRLLVARVLKASNFVVIEAGSAEQALQLLASEGHSCSLLLSDVGLPGLSGAELVKRARQLVPGLPTQLMSGTPKRQLVDDGVLAGDVDLLQKPFLIADLLSRVQQLIDE